MLKFFTITLLLSCQLLGQNWGIGELSIAELGNWGMETKKVAKGDDIQDQQLTIDN